ncbi:DUF438 domain-containing protein [Erysipelothrix inopinata]|uniref:DUF438 domain-containing protein n=1 Tax=Erysipelothrix inopinata TaxID=225084 RepID=A0A7G9S0G4_9FIRM|nr:DUF438 domain-containing protein [Erysipelothrix inopinata]QNN61339.1 DUF438 domain-containing protein [Erysipelothrix inopinata]
MSRNKVEQLADMILRLHEGEDQETVKETFREEFGSVASSEIIAMEQQLVNQGMPIAEIQRLCDIHADIFDGSIEEIHNVTSEMEREGHPVKVLKNENEALSKLLEEMFPNVLDFEAGKDMRVDILSQCNVLQDLNKHYKRKEELYFPLLEKHGYDAPPKVMWGVDDEIRADLNAFHDRIINTQTEGIVTIFEALRKRIEDMIFKEEMILLPMIQDEVTEDDWLQVAEDSHEIGYCIVAPNERWIPYRKSFYDKVKDDLRVKENSIHFEVGSLKFEELEAVMNVLPFDVTFIDKDDIFKYFNQTSERTFFRSKAQIGRKVQHCHPPRSVAMVEAILNDLKSGAKDKESFWIEMGPKLIYITYLAVRDASGRYLGTVEVTQDIKPLQGIEGQKRLR